MKPALMFPPVIGERDGDYLELANKWARVRITRLDQAPLLITSNGEKELGTGYNVTGDTPKHERGFTEIGEALAYACRALATYQTGRGD